MILTIPMQLEAAKKEVPVEFSKIQGSQFNIIKNNILENFKKVMKFFCISSVFHPKCVRNTKRSRSPFFIVFLISL